MSTADRARTFAALHVKGDPVVLYNIWDAGSAKIVAAAGAKALATGSWSVAAAFGYPDGEALPREEAMANIARIVKATALPVSMDLEAGYGDAPATVAETAQMAMERGVVGMNLEDQPPAREGLYGIDEQCARIAAVRAAAGKAGIAFFINARTDVFLNAPAAEHNGEHLAQAVERAQAYTRAGASGIFVPGLVNESLLGEFCAACTLPVNAMMSPATPAPAVLARLGVARISHGPFAYRQMAKDLERAAKAIYA